MQKVTFEATNTGLSSSLMQAIVDTILLHMRPVRIILYGSRARGDYHKTSDIDIAVDSDQDTGPLNPILEETIPTLLKIDVINFRNARESLQKEIRSEGIILYEEASANQ